MGINERERQSQVIDDLSEVCKFPPKAIKLEVSSECNFNCRICYNSKQKLHGLLSKQDFEIALKEIIESGTKQVGVLFLGESTLNPLLPFFIERLKSAGVEYVFLTTNGLLVGGDLMRILLDSGLDSLKWSVNYSSADDFVLQTGSSRRNFDVIMSNIKECFEYRNTTNSKCRLYSSIVVKDVNSIDHDIAQFVNLAIKPYVDEIVYNNLTNHGGLEDGNCCSNIPEQIPCPRIFNNIYIRSNLDVVLCCNGFTDEFKIGNLHDMSLYEVWNCDKMRELRKRHIENRLDETICFLKRR